MASYDEILEKLDAMSDVEFFRFTKNFIHFRFQRRTQYAIFLSARKSYDETVCSILGLKTEAEKKIEAKEEYCEIMAHHILGEEYKDKDGVVIVPKRQKVVKGNNEEEVIDNKDNKDDIESMKWSKVLTSKRPMIIYSVIFTLAILGFLWVWL